VSNIRTYQNDRNVLFQSSGLSHKNDCILDQIRRQPSDETVSTISSLIYKRAHQGSILYLHLFSIQ